MRENATAAMPVPRKLWLMSNRRFLAEAACLGFEHDKNAGNASSPNDPWHHVAGAISLRIISMRPFDARRQPALN